MTPFASASWPLGQALVTVVAVGFLLWVLRRAGPRAGGLLAAVPVSSAPAIFWLSVERGGLYAGQAAIAALVSTALSSVLVGLYARRCARCGPLGCLAVAGTGALGIGAAVQPVLGGWLAGSLAFALLCTLVATRTIPRPADAAPRHSDWRRELLATMVAAGTMTLLVGTLGRTLPAEACGLIAAIPVVCMCTMTALHRRQGAATTCRFLAGYLDGMLAKTFFLAALALTLPMLPPAAAWMAALAAGLAVLVLKRVVARTLASLHKSMRPGWTARRGPADQGA